MQSSQDLVAVIQAAHHLFIEVGPRVWRLVNGTQSAVPLTAPALVEAHHDGVTYAPAFARARRLPEEGLLPPDRIPWVVVGWAPETSSWHLGLMLDEAHTPAGQMRWIALASWPSGDVADYEVPARKAAQSLAEVLGRPLHVVEPPAPAVPATGPVDATRPLQATAPYAPPVEKAPAPAPAAVPTRPPVTLRQPPLDFEEWVYASKRGRFIWRRRTRWVLGSMVRAVGLMIASVVFLLLGLGTQTSDIASVEPAWLPWLGIGVSFIVLVTALRSLGAILTATAVIIDPQRREVRCRSRLSGRTQWHVPFDRVAYVLLSQTPPRSQGGKRQGEPVRVAQDVWLHLYDGKRFWQVVELGRVEGTVRDWDRIRQWQKQKGRRRLVLEDVDSPAHHAALHMAQTLRADAWLDVR